MADPRNTIGFDEIDAEYASMLIDNSTITYDEDEVGGSAQVGLAVVLSGNKTVALTADGDAVAGKLISVEWDGTCRVQVGGFATLPGGNGATLTAGAPFVGALGASSAKGYIRMAAAIGGAFAQAEVRDARNGRGRIVDSSTASETVVQL